MRIPEILTKYDFTQEVAEEAIIASGFSVEEDKEYDAKQVHLIYLYGKYATLMLEASSESHGFKYHDGEEGIDKTLVADNLRRTAQMWYNRWLDEMAKEREKNNREQFSAFHVRKRVR